MRPAELHVCRSGRKSTGLHVDEPDREPVTLSAERASGLPFFSRRRSAASISRNCARSATALRSSITPAKVYGISVDTFFALKAFQTDQNLTFPLLSDFNKEVIRAYGAFNEDMIGLKGIAKRSTFVIDKDGIVRHREVLDDARNEPDYQKVYDTLATLS